MSAYTASQKNPQTTCNKIDRRGQFFVEIKIFILAYVEKQCWEGFTVCKSRKFVGHRKTIFTVLYVEDSFDYFLENTFKRFSHNILLKRIGRWLQGKFNEVSSVLSRLN